MAYMNRVKKAKIAEAIKPVLKKYGIKGTLRVDNNSTIVLTLRSGKIDFIANRNRVCGASDYQVSQGFKPNNHGYANVNPYWFQEHYDGEALAFLTEAHEALKSADWFDKSDLMSDYFHTAYYYEIAIGNWEKQYVIQ